MHGSDGGAGGRGEVGVGALGDQVEFPVHRFQDHAVGWIARADQGVERDVLGGGQLEMGSDVTMELCDGGGMAVILPAPFRDGPQPAPVDRQGLKAANQVLPRARRQDDRHDHAVHRIGAPLDRGQFPIADERAGERGRADQHQEQVRVVDRGLDRGVEMAAGLDAVVVPEGDPEGASQVVEVDQQPFQHAQVIMGVGDEGAQAVIAHH